MKVNPWHVLGVGYPWVTAVITLASTRELLGTLIAATGLVAGLLTIYNAVLTSKKNKLEIRRLEKEESLK